jgi:beta-lactamase regulating signal transducer with metallopeptidase domain/cytochrome c-type biogenesis protein CcmH/NrfG
MIAHLAASTAVAVVAIVATQLLRGQRAAWRHAILFVALLRFAVPTGWLKDIGRRAVRVAPAKLSGFEWMLRGPWLSSGMVTRSPAGPRYEYIWYAGVAVCLVMWTRRTLRRIPAVRAASDAESVIFARAARGADIELRIVAGESTPGAWGWLRPVVLIPDGLSEQLTGAELEAVLAHEVAHLRRMDNLVAAVSHAIVSVLWFHPLVWWIERRMLAEREKACDEFVLAEGTNPRDYAAGILKVCRMSFSGAAGYAGINGSNLENRMEHIMSVDLNRTGSRAARALLGAIMTAAALVPVAGGYLQAQQPVAQQRINPAQTALPLLTEVEGLMKGNRADEALQLLGSAIAKAPQRLDLQMALGNTAVRAGKYDLAIETFQGILAQLDSSSTTAQGDLYLRLGETYRRQGETGPAIASLRRAVELLPDDRVVSSTLALVLDSAGQRAEAEKEYRTVLKLDSNNAVAMNNLAYLLSHSQQHLDEALELALRARELLPNLVEISDTLAWVYLRKNYTNDALAIFEQLVEKHPEESTYHYHLALALVQKGNRVSAAEQLKLALERNPSQEEAEKIRQLLNTLP